jgi:hypothetical protein
MYDSWVPAAEAEAVEEPAPATAPVADYRSWGVAALATASYY